MAGCGYISDRSLGLMFFMIPLLLLSLSFLSHALAMVFQVGDKDGWVVKPLEEYNHWAGRHMFHVNDILYFKYKKGNDSVLVVKKEDYHSCNITNPIHKMDDGNSTFHLNKPSSFFFISGNVNNCKNGQKLIIVVMSASPTPSPSKVLDSPRLLQGPSTSFLGVFVPPGYVCKSPCINLDICNQNCNKEGFQAGMALCYGFSTSDEVCCCKTK